MPRPSCAPQPNARAALQLGSSQTRAVEVLVDFASFVLPTEQK